MWYKAQNFTQSKTDKFILSLLVFNILPLWFLNNTMLFLEQKH